MFAVLPNPESPSLAEGRSLGITLLLNRTDVLDFLEAIDCGLGQSTELRGTPRERMLALRVFLWDQITP